MDRGAWWATALGGHIESDRRVLLKTLWEPSWWLKDREPACDAGDEGLILGWGRSPGEGNGNPLQYSCWETSMDRGGWRAIVHGFTKSRT